MFRQVRAQHSGWYCPWLALADSWGPPLLSIAVVGHHQSLRLSVGIDAVSPSLLVFAGRRRCCCLLLQSLERLGRLEEGNVSEAFSQLSSRCVFLSLLLLHGLGCAWTPCWQPFLNTAQSVSPCSCSTCPVHWVQTNTNLVVVCLAALLVAGVCVHAGMRCAGCDCGGGGGGIYLHEQVTPGRIQRDTR